MAFGDLRPKYPGQRRAADGAILKRQEGEQSLGAMSKIAVRLADHKQTEAAQYGNLDVRFATLSIHHRCQVTRIG
jgi:hypothetical protein